MDSNEKFRFSLLQGDSDHIQYTSDQNLTDATTNRMNISDTTGTVADQVNESTPLLSSSSSAQRASTGSVPTQDVNHWRYKLFLFLEGTSPSGKIYEAFTILLILISVLTFVIGSLFDSQYNPGPLASKCNATCDAIFFGNDANNALKYLNIGATSLLEMFIVAVFTVDYILRIYTADLLHERYSGVCGRIRFIPTFFSVVDLASTLPFYIDAFLLPNTDLVASNFLRMFRLLRMMKMEGRYNLAFSLVDDVFVAQKQILGTAMFVGVTVWSVISSFYYIAERKNTDMIYCDAAPAACFENQEEIDTSLCAIDDFGIVDCSAAGCPNVDGKESCWNLYRSIIDSSFWALMNLFGESPLADQHSVSGKFVGTLTAVVAVAVFALPAGIFGSGFEDQIAKRHEVRLAAEADPSVDSGEDNGSVDEEEWEIVDVVGDESTLRGKMYNFLHVQNSRAANAFDTLINVLIVGTAMTFMFASISVQGWSDWFEFAAVVIFSVEYFCRLYSIGENPSISRCAYVTSFLAIVDLLSFAPFWVDYSLRIFLGAKYSQYILLGELVRWLRLLRLLRFEKYTKAFTTFDDVIRDNSDVLGITGFSAMLLWILFSAILYLLERDNPNGDMQKYYKSVPHAMWVTLLNLSGECPLAFYSPSGKVVQGIIGLFATAIFGVPIGILGAGFEEYVSDSNEDTPDEDTTPSGEDTQEESASTQKIIYDFVNGFGSTAARIFEASIYFLILGTVTVGIIQTVPGKEDMFSELEFIAVVAFTFEYLLRFISAGADPDFAKTSNVFLRSMKYIFSFYSIIDLLAIVPFYLAYLYPNSWIDQNDEYLRMFRLLRLLKLDKYIPSFSLIDDVIRLKKNSLIVSGFAAMTLWILFSGIMYVAESSDESEEIDNLPLYGCVENCHMDTRFSTFWESFSLVGIHLTGDFPLIEYDGFGRVICFFLVITAVGVVSIPSSIIASGFVEVVQSKQKTKLGEVPDQSGDDWFDIQYKNLANVDPPLSIFGPCVDKFQTSVHEYLDGYLDTAGNKHRSTFSSFGRFAFFSLIIANVVAVVLESVPEIDLYVGNEKNNFFDAFEAISVTFFTIEYILRLIAARKSREALYSPWIYAITFFGLVDFISIFPWYVQWYLKTTGHSVSGDQAKIFRILRIFRVLQLEDFIIAFSKLDNVFRASKGVLKATGLMAILVWIGAAALFFIFEENNPNFRSCDGSISSEVCYSFSSTAACNEANPGMCSQSAFTSMPNAIFFVAIFLNGEWAFVDFTFGGKLVCLFLCVAGIGIYAIPTGTLFDSFGAVLGMGEDDDDDEDDEFNSD